MGEWTSLMEVETSRAKGQNQTFSSAIVWIVNHVSPNPYPRKFLYQACPVRLPTGRMCSKSLEFAPCPRHAPLTKHEEPLRTWKFRFMVIIVDAMHGETIPLHVNLWDAASLLLRVSPEDFSKLAEVEQLSYMNGLMETTPKAEVILRTVDKGITVQHLILLGESPELPLSTARRGSRTPESSSKSSISSPFHTPVKALATPGKPGSSKKLLQSLCNAILSADLSDSELIVLFEGMPKVSNRQQCLKWTRQNLYLSILIGSSSSDDDGMSGSSASSSCSSGILTPDSDAELMSSSDSDVEIAKDPSNVLEKPSEWFQLHAVLESQRYLDSRCKTWKAKEFADTFFRSVITASHFRQICRMDKEAFFDLHDLIESHPVFMNESRHEQAHVSLQLATCLDRIGHTGNGVCLKRTLLLWGISIGSCINFTKRCVTALESTIGDFLKWPDSAERREISSEFALKGFPGCVGLIDGTTLPLTQRPKNHGECYYDRKSRYSVNAQIVCDYKRKILFLDAGMPGSCSDITCLKKCILWDKIHANDAFDDGQYIMGDSGYVSAPHMVAAIKNTRGQKDQEDFNTCIAKTRYVNEHCIGVLKSRWYSLKEIRTQLNEKKDNVWLCRWVRAAALLHNYVLAKNDIWSEEDMFESPLDLPEENQEGTFYSRGIDLSRNRAARAAGRSLQTRVMARALAHNRQATQCTLSDAFLLGMFAHDVSPLTRGQRMAAGFITEDLESSPSSRRVKK